MALLGAIALHPSQAQDATVNFVGVKDSVYGDGLEVSVQGAPTDGGLAAGLNAGQLAHARHLLAAVAWRLNPNVSIASGLGMRSENAGIGLNNDAYRAAKLNASNFFVRLDSQALESLGLDGASIAYIHTRVRDQELARNTLNSQKDSVIDMGSFTRYLTEYYEQQKITRFEGLNSHKLVADAVFFIGPSGELTLNLGLLNDSQNGTRGAVGATGKYFGRLGGTPFVPFVSVNKNLSGAGESLAFGAEIGLSDHVSATVGHQIYRGALQSYRDTRIGIIWNLLPNDARFERKSGSQALNAAGVVGKMLADSIVRISPVANQGQLKTTTNELNKLSESIRDVEKPKPPVTPDPVTPDPVTPDPVTPIVPPTPNTPLNIGNISCTATVIQHGQTTTCQITPVDPDGIQSLRAEINGGTLSVTKSSSTYTITIPAGLPAGGAT